MNFSSFCTFLFWVQHTIYILLPLPLLHITLMVIVERDANDIQYGWLTSMNFNRIILMMVISVFSCALHAFVTAHVRFHFIMYMLQTSNASTKEERAQQQKNKAHTIFNGMKHILDTHISPKVWTATDR